MGAPNPKTFCTLPFNHFCVGSEGTARVCCVTSEQVSEHGAPMSLLASSMDEIRNSAYMRGVRRAMLRGERVSACEVCYASEEASGASYRTLTGQGPVDGETVTADDLMAFGEPTGYRVGESPSFIKLEISNLCNLKCRMCWGGNSSQIERDPVHNRWAGGADPMHALWRGTTARIGPEPRIGVRASGLFPVEGPGQPSHRWTDGQAVFNVPLRLDTRLEARDIEFDDSGPSGQSYQVVVNGRRRARGRVDPAHPDVRIDLGGLDHKGRLVVEISSGRSIDAPGRPERGVALKRIELRRRGENSVSHPQIVGPTPIDAPWYDHDDKLFGDLLRSPSTLRRLYITGGEPFINDRFEAVLDHLIENNAAGHIEFEVSTNCTHVDPRLLDKIRKFRHARLFLSLDSIADSYEYIRHPGRWDVVDRNVRLLKRTPGLDCLATPVVQLYNILGITDLFRYCDALDLDFSMNILHEPAHLAIQILPPRARAVAAERLMRYLDEIGDRADGRSAVLALANFLQNDHRPTDFKTLRRFMLFTNDLDATRGQSFRTVHRELVELMAEDGFEWTDETVFAQGDTRHKPARDRAYAWV